MSAESHQLCFFFMLSWVRTILYFHFPPLEWHLCPIPTSHCDFSNSYSLLEKHRTHLLQEKDAWVEVGLRHEMMPSHFYVRLISKFLLRDYLFSHRLLWHVLPRMTSSRTGPCLAVGNTMGPCRSDNFFVFSAKLASNTLPALSLKQPGAVRVSSGFIEAKGSRALVPIYSTTGHTALKWSETSVSSLQNLGT